jgi:hypothetical protein
MNEDLNQKEKETLRKLLEKMKDYLEENEPFAFALLDSIGQVLDECC